MKKLSLTCNNSFFFSWVHPSARARPGPHPARCERCPRPHKPKVSSLKASYNPRKHHYHHHHHYCYHHIHHRHYYLFIPLKYLCIIIIIVEIPMILSCPGPEPDQKAPAPRTRCQLLPGSLSSQDREQEGRGQSVLFVWRTSLLVISTDTSDTCTDSSIS